MSATLDEFCHCGALAADCVGWGEGHDARITEHMARQSEDAILARVLRRFLAPTVHPAHHPYVDIGDNDIILDGHADLVPGDADVLRRVTGAEPKAEEDPPDAQPISEVAELRALLHRWLDAYDPDDYDADQYPADDTATALGLGGQTP